MPFTVLMVPGFVRSGFSRIFRDTATWFQFKSLFCTLFHPFYQAATAATILIHETWSDRLMKSCWSLQHLICDVVLSCNNSKFGKEFITISWGMDIDYLPKVDIVVKTTTRLGCDIWHVFTYQFFHFIDSTVQEDSEVKFSYTWILREPVFWPYDRTYLTGSVPTLLFPPIH